MTFIIVVIAAVVGNHYRLPLHEIPDLVLLFFLFQLWYGAIYMINDVVDYEDDLKNPDLVARRPIASGAISLPAARTYICAILLVDGVTTFLVFRAALPFLLGFLAFNLVYTLVLNQIPYVDAFANAVTYAGRGYMGMYLFGGYIAATLLLATYLFALSLSLIRRMKEKRNEEPGRPTLSRYSLPTGKVLCIGAVALSAALVPFTSLTDLPILIFITLWNFLVVFGFFHDSRVSAMITSAFNFF